MAEVLVELDRTAGRLVEQLVTGLRPGIRAGRIDGRTELPASRVLAADLRVSRGVVVEAYQQLAAEGYVVTRAGSGTRVADGCAAAAAEAIPAPAPPAPRYDLWPGTPDLAAFPRAAWLAAMRRAFDTLPHSGLGYGDPGGVLRFREEIAAYVNRVRAADAAPERTIALSGVSHGMALGLKALRERGHRVLAVEDPSADRPRRLLAASGFDVVGVPVDGDGLVVAELERTAASVVMATPAHQYPTGVVLAPARRAALLDWGRRHDGMVIEDDYDAEFRYDRTGVGCLQGLPDRVLYLGSTSKSLAPALRLGWAVAPRWLADRMRELRDESDLGGPVVEHLALAQFVSSGGYDRHLRILRRHYRRRRDALVTALRDAAPDWRVTGIAAGLHLLVELPTGTDEAALVEAATDDGVRLQALAPMRFAPGGPGLVLGYAALSSTRLAEAASVLARSAR